MVLKKVSNDMGDYDLNTEPTIDQRASEAAASSQVIDIFAAEMRPFIRLCASRQNSDGRLGDHDEADSVALFAFCEAVKAYDLSKGHFLPFAANIIKRRCIDERRRRSRDNLHTFASYDDPVQSDYLIERASLIHYSKEEQGGELRLEMEEFIKELAKWEITLEDLVKHSPRHHALQALCKKAAACVWNDLEIFDLVMKKRYIPMKRICEKLEISPKKLERFRKYIIAAIIIGGGDFPLMKKYVEGGGSIK